MKKIFPIIIFFIFIFGCGTQKLLNEEILKESYKIIESNLYFLASDELEGRETTSHGEKVAAQFIASQLSQYGVKPFGDSSTYFQNFELEKSQILPSSKITFITDNDQHSLELQKDFIPFKGGDSIEESEMIFVGYGIYDSSINYNDYQNIDVSGKIVVCISGSPKDLEISKTLEKYNRSSAKAIIAAKKGAKGIIVLQSAQWAKRWERLIKYGSGSSIDKISSSKTEINAAWIDTLTAKSLFKLENISYAALIDTLSAGFIKLGEALNTKASMKIDLEKELLPARNIVGIIEGNDPSLADEIVTIGAHYDHEGIKNGQVYNGADDNGSGTVSILESARQIATLRTNERPIVFIFYTGEEKGLLGSDYFVNNSENIENVIVNINIDMVGRESEDSLFVVGSGKISSELYDIVELINIETTKFHFDYTYDDESNPERIYFRSDHWKFAEKGIPIVFLTDMHSTDYHKPTDTPDKINYKKIVKVAGLTTAIALKVANLDHKLIRDKLQISGK